MPTAPTAPTAVCVSPGDGSAVVSWTAPTSDGGSAMVGSLLCPYLDGVAQRDVLHCGAPAARTVNGLTDGGSYRFTVLAFNKAFGGNNGYAYGYSTLFDEPSIRAATDARGDCSFAASLTGTNRPFDSFTLTSYGTRDAVVARIDADPPQLEILYDGNSVVMSWPTNQPGFGLECANSLPPTNGWSVVTKEVTLVGAQNFVSNPITAGSQFYRLRKK